MKNRSPKITRNFLDLTISALDLNLIKREAFQYAEFGKTARFDSITIHAYLNIFVISNGRFIREAKIDPIYEIFQITFYNSCELRVELLNIDKADFFNCVVQNDMEGMTYDDVIKIKQIIDKMNSEIYSNWGKV